MSSNWFDRPVPRTDDFRELQAWYDYTARRIKDSIVSPVQGAEIDVGAITASHISSGSVTLDAFYAGLRPVQIVSSLPSLPDANYPANSAVVLLTSDGKLYRNVSDAWVRTLPTTDLTGQITTTQITDEAVTTPKVFAGAIGTDQLAANSVVAGKVAAGAIAASHMLISGGSQKGILQDPEFEDSSAWYNNGGPGSMVIEAETTAPDSKNVLTNTSGNGPYIETYRYYKIDTAKAYRVRFWARSVSSADGVLYFCLRQFTDDNGTACATNNGRSPYKPSGVTVPTSWTSYSYEWSGSDWQSGVRFVRPNWLLNYGGTTGMHEISGVRFEEMNVADLIVDGAIKTSKIFSGSYTAPGNDNTTPGAGMKLDVDNGKIEAYGDSHSLGGNLVSSDGNYLVSIGRYLTSTGLGKRYPLHNSTNFTADGRTHIYRWTGTAWLATLDAGYNVSAGSIIDLTMTDNSVWGLNVQNHSGYTSSTGVNVYITTSSSYGVKTIATYGIYASGAAASGGIGGTFVEGSGETGAPICLNPSTSSSAPTHTAPKGSLWVTSAGVLYINTDGSTTWGKVGAQ